MRNLLLACLLGLACCLSADAAVDKAIATVTIDNTVGGVALPATLIKPAGRPQMSRCFGRLETAEVRYWDDGTAPTTTTGIVVEPLETFTFDDYDAMVKWRGIRTTATSGTLSIECWR